MLSFVFVWSIIFGMMLKNNKDRIMCLQFELLTLICCECEVLIKWVYFNATWYRGYVWIEWKCDKVWCFVLFVVLFLLLCLLCAGLFFSVNFWSVNGRYAKNVFCVSVLFQHRRVQHGWLCTPKKEVDPLFILWYLSVACHDLEGNDYISLLLVLFVFILLFTHHLLSSQTWIFLPTTILLPHWKCTKKCMFNKYVLKTVTAAECECVWGCAITRTENGTKWIYSAGVTSHV